MTTDDDPQARVALLPTFKQPPTPPPTTDPQPPLDHPSRTVAAVTTDLRPGPTSRPMWHGRPGSPEPGSASGAAGTTPTETSSGGDLEVDKPSRAEVIALVVGLLGAVTIGVSAVVRWRTGRKLRQPTRNQAQDIAAPLGRIAHRLAEFSWLGPNVIDGIKAMTATGAYLNDGPLLLGPDVDAGIPAGLQDPLED